MSEPSEATERPVLDEEREVRTRHVTALGGRELAYTATVRTLHLEATEAAPRAAVFSVAYTLDGVEDPSERPVTFCFNGGPGSSSVWLHLGAFGPKRVVLPDPEVAPPPPYRLVDNDLGILDLTDLVFIDPVGTGFSEADPGAEGGAGPFHGLAGDTDSVGRFILQWLAREGRWTSPKLLAGESYGTTRSAALAEWLADKGCFLNGLVLVSVALQFQTFVTDRANDLALVCFLPGLAATAAWHGRVDPGEGGLEAFIDEARTFAREEYAPALFQGTELPEAERQRVARGLARLTGLSAEAIAERGLRVEPMWFTKQLLPGADRVVGRLDGRYVGRDGAPDQALAQRDPSYDAALGAYTALINDHLRRTLGWETDQPYEVLSMAVNQAWDWRAEGGLPFGFPDLSGALHTALCASPGTKVLCANGLYDLATPFGATEHTLRHLRLPEELRDNVRSTSYPAGHMMYFHPPSLAALRADLVAFYAWCCPPITS